MARRAAFPRQLTTSLVTSNTGPSNSARSCVINYWNAPRDSLKTPNSRPALSVEIDRSPTHEDAAQALSDHTFTLACIGNRTHLSEQKSPIIYGLAPTMIRPPSVAQQVRNR
jgi:hypothetical protein